CFVFSSRRRHTRSKRDWSSDVCSSDLEDENAEMMGIMAAQGQHYDATNDKNTEYDLYDDVTKVGPFYIDEEDDEFVLRVRSYDVTIVTEPNAVVTFLD